MARQALVQLCFFFFFFFKGAACWSAFSSSSSRTPLRSSSKKWPHRAVVVETSDAGRLARVVPVGDGWDDLKGDGRCWRRVVSTTTTKSKTQPPKPGCLCTVEWTAWLGALRPEDGLYEKGQQMGNLLENSTLEFTLGGGRYEATESWDVAVSEMRPGDTVDVFAAPEYAFGKDAAEPHLPFDSKIFFRLTLLDWKDWAEGRDVIYGLHKADEEEDSDVFRDALEQAADQHTEHDAPVDRDDDDDQKRRPAPKREGSLVEDLGALDVRDSFGADAQDPSPNVPNAYADRRPTFADASALPPCSVDGEGKGYSWSETADEMFLRVDAPEQGPPVSAADVTVDFRPDALAITLRGDVLLEGFLEGPVYSEDCTWAVAEDRRAVDVFLAKRRRGTMPRLGSESSHDDMVLDEDEESSTAPPPPRKTTKDGASLADIWATVFRAKTPPQSPLPL